MSLALTPAVRHEPVNCHMSSNDNKGQQDGMNPDEDLDLDLKLDGTEDTETLKTKLQEERTARVGGLSYIKQTTARAKKAEEDLKTLQNDPRLKSGDDFKGKETDPGKKGNEGMDAMNDEVVDLRLDGYSKDEVKFIMANGGRKALDDKTSLTSIAINSAREQKKAEQAKDDAGAGGGSELIAGKYSQDQLSKMSASELEKILPHAQ